MNFSYVNPHFIDFKMNTPILKIFVNGLKVCYAGFQEPPYNLTMALGMVGVRSNNGKYVNLSVAGVEGKPFKQAVWVINRFLQTGDEVSIELDTGDSDAPSHYRSTEASADTFDFNESSIRELIHQAHKQFSIQPVQSAHNSDTYARGFEVKLNGKLLGRAGFDAHTADFRLNCMVNMFDQMKSNSPESEVRVWGREKSNYAIARWITHPLSLGDHLMIKIITDTFDPPQSITDSGLDTKDLAWLDLPIRKLFPPDQSPSD